MANLKTFSGFPIQNLTSDPVPYAQALADNPYSGAWSSGGNLNTVKVASMASGTQTAMIIAGGYDGTAPGDSATAENYNGSTWTEVADLNTARQNLFNGVGTSSTAALAVAGGSPPYGQTVVAIVESWNGSSWTEVADLNTARNSGGGSGSSTAGLVAGGGQTVKANVESWDGSAWTETTDINTARRATRMTGTSTDSILVAGFTTADVGNVETWNGSSWTETTDINTTRDNVATSGTSSTAALAFGGNTTTFVANTESWDGSSWTEVADLAGARSASSTTPAGTTISALTAGGSSPAGPGVTNTTEEWSFSGLNPATTPAADYSDAIVGQMYYNSTSGQFKAIKNGGAPIGTWASVSSMNTARGRLGGFGSATAAIGAGGVLPPNGVTDAVEQYNGSSWTEIAEINTARYTANFQFGTTTNGIVAGGSLTGPGTPTQAVVEQWNGTAWTEVGDLNKNKSQGGASGTYTAGVIFGGFTLPGGPPTYAILAETETWNGSAWTEVNDLNNQRYTNAAAIGGPSTATITFGRANQTPDSIVESWDGTNWTEVGDLNEGRESPGGAGTQTAAMAFGGTPNAALNEIWNGSSWTEANDLGTGRSQMGNAGTTNTSALAFGGASPSYTTAAEEFTAADFTINPVTTS